MQPTMNITSGDIAGGNLEKSSVPGDVFVWHDILYDGPRKPGWPDSEVIDDRARYLEASTGGGLKIEGIRQTLKDQYDLLRNAGRYNRIVLWFDACLFDQSMLAHILACMDRRQTTEVELLCVDAFPGIVPYNGLGQLSPPQLASVYDQRKPVTAAQYDFAKIVDDAFATQDIEGFTRLSQQLDAPLSWIPAAVARWLKERPDPKDGLGQLERLALRAIRTGCKKPGKIFEAVAKADTPPQYWGDITLWAKINGLADRDPPLVQIRGPKPRLPQWGDLSDLKGFFITATDVDERDKSGVSESVDLNSHCR